MDTTFEKLIAPLKLFLEQQGTEIDRKTGSRKLFFANFSRILIYAFTMGIPSLRQLITELETNSNCKKLGLNPIPFSTLKDGFTRFPSKFFEKMYQEVIKNSNWLCIVVQPPLNRTKSVKKILQTYTFEKIRESSLKSQE